MADVDAGSSVQAMRRREVLAACQIPPDNGAISFRAEGNGLRYCARGWSAAEHWGTWNDGATAELAFRNEGSCDSEMTLQLVVQAYVNDNSRTQRMNLRVGEWSRTTSLATEGPHHVEIPLGVLTMHPTIVNFEFPDACSPSVHDPRRIAVGLTSAELVIRADDTGACG